MNKINTIVMLSLLLSSTSHAQNHTQNHTHGEGKKHREHHTHQQPTKESVLPKATHIFKDITYKTVADKALTLDVYLPSEDTDKAPLVVWVHGGAWKRGDKTAFTYKNNRLLNMLLGDGYAVASINYRLSGEATYPAPVQDINDAIEFLFQNSNKFHVDNNRIAMMGRSAGAHLAGLIALSNAHEVADFITDGDKPRFDIDAFVGFFGVYDMLELDKKYDNPSKNSPEAKFLGDIPGKIVDTAKQASPLNYVAGNTPPTLLLHGTDDDRVPVNQSKILKAALDKAAVANELYLLQGGHHGDPTFDTPEYVEKVQAFLNQYFPVTP